MEGRPDIGPGQFTVDKPDGFHGVCGATSVVHQFADGNGRVARIMMNAELVAAGESRIVVPTVFPSGNLVGTAKRRSVARWRASAAR